MKKIAALLALCLTLGCLTACGGGNSGSTSGEDVSSGTVSSETGSDKKTSPFPAPEPVGELVLPEELPENFVFDDGSGTWANYLAVSRDGSFISAYTDVSVEEVGLGYPGGTVYYCNHEDMFRDIQQVNDYTWTMTLEVEEGEMEFGENWLETGVLYVFTEPFGLTGGTSFSLYSPDTPLNELDENFLKWWPDNGKQTEEQATLGCWAICNDVMGYGFFSVSEDWEPDDFDL